MIDAQEYYGNGLEDQRTVHHLFGSVMKAHFKWDSVYMEMHAFYGVPGVEGLHLDQTPWEANSRKGFSNPIEWVRTDTECLHYLLLWADEKNQNRVCCTLLYDLDVLETVVPWP
jgi:hypothetical protein